MIKGIIEHKDGMGGKRREGRKHRLIGGNVVMEIRSLLFFRLAYENGSIGKAAKRAFISRQGMSHALKELENELQQLLFVRTITGLEPTDIAHEMYPRVIELLKNYQSIEEICRVSKKPEESVRLSVSLGVLSSIPFVGLVELFSDEYPGIHLEVDSIEPVLAESCIAEGTRDLGLIVGTVSGSKTRCVSLCQIPLYAAVHESLLAGTGAPSFKDLDGLTWFGVSEDFPIDSEIISLCRKQEVALDFSYDLGDYHLITEQVQRQKGACIVPETRITTFCQNGIIAIPLDDPALTWEIGIIIADDRPVSPGVQTTFDWFREKLMAGAVPS